MYKTFSVRTPGSCGEMIQGFYGQQEMLISYPIDMYSEVKFTIRTDEEVTIGRKSQQAVECFFHETGMDRSLFQAYSISIDNRIPVGKGMASSTADIAGVLYGLHHLYDLTITEEQLAVLCCQIEPTDSTIFKKLTLFDHINGEAIESYDWTIECDVLVLEPEYQINTMDFRTAKKEQLFNKNHDSEALDIFRRAINQESIDLLCQSTHLSAVENQDILEKPYLLEILEAVDQLGCYGVNVAHSGSVVAILFNASVIDKCKLIDTLKKSNCLNYYKKQYMTKMIQGGSEILED